MKNLVPRGGDRLWGLQWDTSLLSFVIMFIQHYILTISHTRPDQQFQFQWPLWKMRKSKVWFPSWSLRYLLTSFGPHYAPGVDSGIFPDSSISFICRLCENSGSLNFLKPSGPIYACTGIPLPFFRKWKCVCTLNRVKPFVRNAVTQKDRWNALVTCSVTWQCNNWLPLFKPKASGVFSRAQNRRWSTNTCENDI
jgi:hypothetical protein